MALTFTDTYTQNVTGLTGLITNTTVYGGANQDRNEAAEYRLWAKLNSAGVRTYYNPDQGDVLNQLTYTVGSTLSGWFQDILLRIQFYDSGANYVAQVTNSQGVITTYASIIYSAGKVYKSRIDSIGQSPSNTTYFTEVPFESLYTLLSNTNIEVKVTDHYVDAQINQQLSSLFSSKNCGCQLEDLTYIVGLDALKISADAEFSNADYNDGQELIESIEAQITTLT